MFVVLLNLDVFFFNIMNSNFCYFDDVGFNYKQFGLYMVGGGWVWVDFVVEVDFSNLDMQKVGGCVFKCF